MKIYSIKHFINGLLWLILGLGLVALILLDKFTVQRCLFAIISFIGGIFTISESFSSDDMEKIQDEIHDERNKLIDSYSKSLTFSIIQYILIISEILLMLIYYYTNNEVFITFLIPIGLIVFLTFVIHFIALIYYEKKL